MTHIWSVWKVTQVLHLAEEKTEAQCGVRIDMEAWIRTGVYCYLLLGMYLLLLSGLPPALSRQLAEGCSRSWDTDPNWKAQGLWLVTFLFRPRAKHKCELSVPRQKLVTPVHVQASLSQRTRTISTTFLMIRTSGKSGLWKQRVDFRFWCYATIWLALVKSSHHESNVCRRKCEFSTRACNNRP